MEVAGKSLPLMTNNDKGRFGVIVFENYTKYLHMDKWNKEILDKYCREYTVGILGFMPSQEETLVGAQLKNTSLYIDTNLRLKVSFPDFLTHYAGRLTGQAFTPAIAHANTQIHEEELLSSDNSMSELYEALIFFSLS